MITADFLIAHLGLKPLPREGGYYVETYRSSRRVPGAVLPDGYDGARDLATAIFYLLTPDTCSALHRLPGDEIYHFYLGDPVELVQLYPNGEGTLKTLGHGLEAGMQLQVVVPGGVWQGSRLKPSGRFALLGTTMAPGFAFEDFQAADRADLLRTYPVFTDQILVLTP